MKHLILVWAVLLFAACNQQIQKEKTMEQIEMEIWKNIQAMNRCWTRSDSNELDKLNNYFHKSMVGITPTDKYRLEGREACFDGYKTFVQNAKIHHWKETDPAINIYGNAAVVTYYFDMSFDMDGQTVNMGGRDMFTLIHEDGKWWIVADQFSPYPQQ